MQRKIIGILFAALTVIAIGACKKDKKTSAQNSQNNTIFNHTVELTVNGEHIFSEGIHLNHFEETNKIDFYSLPGGRFVMIRMADTLLPGTIYPITQDPYTSEVYLYYSPHPDSTGYLALPGSTMKIMEHNTESKHITAVFSATMQPISGSGNTISVNNGKIKIDY